MNYLDKLKTLPPEVQEAAKDKRTISVSKYNTLDCPLKYKFQYEDKLPTEDSRALLMGSAFDWLCDSNISVQDGREIITLDLHDGVDTLAKLSDADVDLIVSRYELYRHHINYDQDWLQFPVWSELPGSWYFFGFADRVKVFHSPGHKSPYKPETIIDNKFSQKPWPFDKVKETYTTENGLNVVVCSGGWKYQSYNPQRFFYTWGVDNMGYGKLPFEFHVMNAQDDTLQIFNGRTMPKSVEGVPEKLIASIELIKSGVRNHVIDKHCEWCGYADLCPALKAMGVNIDDF